MNYYELQEVSNLYPVSSGSRYREKKKGTLQKDGTIKLFSVGRQDVYADIQSYESETDINSIIARASNGDFSGFENGRGDGIFGDFTEMPSSYFEVLNTVIEGKHAFERLPLEVKEKFDNDFNKWFISAGENDWFEKMGYDRVKQENNNVDQKEEVKNNVEE